MNINKKKTQYDSGLTLVELLVYLAIFALLIGVGVPSFKAFVKRTEISSALRTATQAISSARYQAIEKNRRVMLTIEGNKIVLKEKRDGTWQPFTDFDAGDRVTLTINSAPVFYPEGCIVPLCSIYVKNESENYRITISLAGRIKVQKL